MSTKANMDISSKIIEAVVSHRKMSERFIGYVQYDLKFNIVRYSGTSQKPEKNIYFRKNHTEIDKSRYIKSS